MSVIKVGLNHIEKWNESLEAQVLRYEEENSAPGQIVFYGPSNFTRWSTRYKRTPLREAMPGKSGNLCCVNRGFGSSCPEHHLYYYNRMVKAIAPKVLVYAPGVGNGMIFGYTPEEQFQLAARVVLYAKADFPDLRVYIQGVDLWHKNTEARRNMNTWLKELCQEVPDCTFLDISEYEPMHRTDIYVEDNVHYNAEGYQLYADFYKEMLKKELELY